MNAGNISIKANENSKPITTGSFFVKANESNKPIISNTSVNVIYFTNKCNLACTYCYEDLPGRPPQILTKEQIKNLVDEIIAKEDPNEQTLLVLFGGEATLEWENVCYCMEYAYSKKKNIHFNLETNGIKFLSQKFIDEVKSNFFYRTNIMSMDVSFDGVGNQDRVYHNGEPSTGSMLQVFKNLVENNMKFRLRYTVHKHNIDYLYDDVTRLAKLFGPARVILSIAWDVLEPGDQEKLESVKKSFRSDWINKDITIPICDLFCDMCNGCGARKETKSYYTDEGNVNSIGIMENQLKFKDFKQKGQI